MNAAEEYAAEETKPPLDAVQNTWGPSITPFRQALRQMGKLRRSGHECADLAGQPNPATMPSPDRQTSRSRKQSDILKLRIGASRLRRNVAVS